MKVSLNWIKEFTSVNLPVDELVEKIGAQLGAVEEVIDLGKKYQGILMVKVVECEKHHNADKLSFCLVDDGKVNKKVKRNSEGLIEIVCGAPNVKAGQLVAWIPPGVAVPSTYDKEPFVIEAREIRGKISNGMLASPKELDLGDNHEGILILDNGKPGDNFAKNLWLDDYVIDIENKMFTHRPDCFGVLGVAREVAGINHQAFKSPDWYRVDASLPVDGRKNVLKLKVNNELPNLVPRFCAVAIKDIKVGPSPAWMQSFLTRVGVRPINNIVDITNLVMLETAQPLHAYDYDKLKTGTLGVRMNKKGEQLTLLGGKTIKLDHEAVVITDGDRPIGLGGVMGGADTEVDEHTKNIVLEVANFDMNTTRRTAMAYGLFTDAATRFTKGQSPLQNMAALTRAVDQIKQFAGGRQASQVIDDENFRNDIKPVSLDTKFINDRLGLELAPTAVKKLLENVEFKVKMIEKNHTTTQNDHLQGPALQIEVPFWRTDIEIPEDIVEEVGRLYGYDKLPVKLPMRDLSPVKLNPDIAFKDCLRDILAQAGANEVLTYSFVHGSLMQKVGQDPKDAYQIANALSPDVQYYRLSLTPSLLDKVHSNIRAGFNEFALYEIGSGHVKGELDKEKLPKEFQRLSLVIASRKDHAGAAYFAAKKVCDYLLHELGIDGAQYSPLGKTSHLASPTYYDPYRAAEIKFGNTLLGRVGEYKSNVKSSLKLPQFCAGFDLHINDLCQLSSPHKYRPLNRYPELEQDITLRSPADSTYFELTGFIDKELIELCKPPSYEFYLKPIDIFQKAGDKQHKQTTWRIILFHPEQTLTTQETNQLLDKLAAKAKQELNAERI